MLANEYKAITRIKNLKLILNEKLVQDDWVSESRKRFLYDKIERELKKRTNKMTYDEIEEILEKIIDTE